MNIIDLIDRLDREGIKIEVAGARLRFAPKNISDDLVEIIKAHKPAILEAARLPGWPTSIPVPGWLVELVAGFPPGVIIRARAQNCGDAVCRYPVAVYWRDGINIRRWSCPRCGLASEKSPRRDDWSEFPAADYSNLETELQR